MRCTAAARAGPGGHAKGRFSVGTTFALQDGMRRVLTFVLGVIIGQWLVFGAQASPADYHLRAQRAMRAHDYLEAMQLWSQAATLQPAEPSFHYYRGVALARLGLKLSAIDCFQMALLLEPAPQLARMVLQE